MPRRLILYSFLFSATNCYHCCHCCHWYHCCHCCHCCHWCHINITPPTSHLCHNCIISNIISNITPISHPYHTHIIPSHNPTSHIYTTTVQPTRLPRTTAAVSRQWCSHEPKPPVSTGNTTPALPCPAVFLSKTIQQMWRTLLKLPPPPAILATPAFPCIPLYHPEATVRLLLCGSYYPPEMVNARSNTAATLRAVTYLRGDYFTVVVAYYRPDILWTQSLTLWLLSFCGCVQNVSLAL